MEGDTNDFFYLYHIEKYFYPRPPGGGRRAISRSPSYPLFISIHALRVEGDYRVQPTTLMYTQFLSTPSGWRATFTTCRPKTNSPLFLSTPSGWRATQEMAKKLRVSRDFYPRPPGGGRRISGSDSSQLFNFYPRPPGGGRRSRRAAVRQRVVFLSTPSGWRATVKAKEKCPGLRISIHALRVEGDRHTPIWTTVC